MFKEHSVCITTKTHLFIYSVITRTSLRRKPKAPLPDAETFTTAYVLKESSGSCFQSTGL